MNKQITIYELLPLFRPGCWVAMRPSGDWCCFPKKPTLTKNNWVESCLILSRIYEIAPFDGDWKDSLMEVK